MGIKGILFDKDGTLIDFFEVWGKSVNPVIDKILFMYGLEQEKGLKERILTKMGVHGEVIDPEGSFAWKSFAMIAEEIAEEMTWGRPEVSVNDVQLKEYLTVFFDQEINSRWKKFPVFTDLIVLMEELHQMGISTGIVTTDEYQATKECMIKTGICHQISFLGTAGTDMPVKPDKELLFMAAGQWKIEPAQIAVVGDTPNDMRFAKNAGAIAIGVLSGTGKRKDLEQHADYVIDSVDNLMELVKMLNRKENKYGKNRIKSCI